MSISMRCSSLLMTAPGRCCSSLEHHTRFGNGRADHVILSLMIKARYHSLIGHPPRKRERSTNGADCKFNHAITQFREGRRLYKAIKSR